MTTISQVKQINFSSIEKINHFKETGLEIRGFVGRAPSRTEIPLPARKTNEIWVSIDIKNVSEDAPIDPDRVHLVINCNKADQMETIQGLFNTLVIDRSTAKFFDTGTLEYFVSAIQRGGSLVLPSDLQTIGLDYKIETFETNHFSLTVGAKKHLAHSEAIRKFSAELFERLTNGKVQENPMDNHADLVRNLDEYKTWASERKFVSKMEPSDQIALFLSDYSAESIPPVSYQEEKSAAREQTKNRLLELFENVQICNQIYPYPNRYDDNGTTPTIYFSATGRK